MSHIDNKTDKKSQDTDAMDQLRKGVEKGKEELAKGRGEGPKRGRPPGGKKS